MRPTLDTLHPVLQTALPKVLAAMDALGFPMVVTQGVRTTQEQIALYAQGRTTPGHIVTNSDGLLHVSNHQVKADGFGHAFDCAFVLQGQPSWDLHLPWRAYGECGKALGLKWGGDWASIHDLPHLEL